MSTLFAGMSALMLAAASWSLAPAAPAVADGCCGGGGCGCGAACDCVDGCCCPDCGCEDCTCCSGSGGGCGDDCGGGCCGE